MRLVRPGRGVRDEAGFTLFEALVSVAMMGLILSLLAVITGQWLPRWRAGFHRLERAELVSLALDRLTSDLAAAEFIEPIGDTKVLFRGSADAVIFVRTPIGPKPSEGATPTGLEILKLSSDGDGNLTRARTVFTPQSSVAVSSDDFDYSDTTILLRPPLKISFGYAGPDRNWTETWNDPASLPTAVRITVRDSGSDEVLSVSTAALIHVNAPASCASATASSQCLTDPNKVETPAKDGAQPSSGAPTGAPPTNGAVL